MEEYGVGEATNRDRNKCTQNKERVTQRCRERETENHGEGDTSRQKDLIVIN
jgi:hypothetical protein